MAKRMLADVLWEAANRRLSVDQWDTGEEYEYSCWAADRVAGEAGANRHGVTAFLRSLGCDTGAVQKFDTPHGEARQGVRYMWLLLAMHVAADEGLTV